MPPANHSLASIRGRQKTLPPSLGCWQADYLHCQNEDDERYAHDGGDLCVLSEPQLINTIYVSDIVVTSWQDIEG
jgi:hypothetical protein